MTSKQPGTNSTCSALWVCDFLSFLTSMEFPYYSTTQPDVFLKKIFFTFNLAFCAMLNHKGLLPISWSAILGKTDVVFQLTPPQPAWLFPRLLLTA